MAPLEPPPGPRGTFRALRARPFALLWSGQTVSRVGDFLYQVALAWWVLEKTGSAAEMATLLILTFTPMVLFVLLGGVAGDRLPRVPIMLASDVARAVLVTGVAALAAADALEIWHLYAASLVFGFVDAFFQPAYMAAIPDLVPAEHLPSANALTSIGLQAGRVVGPALGGVVVAWGGVTLAFALNAATFWIAAGFLLPLLRHPASRPHAPSEATGKRGVLADLRAGLGLVVRTPWLWLTILVSALANITLSGPYSIAMPFLVGDVWHADADTLGQVYAAFPIGYVVGGLWLGRQGRIRHRALLVFGGTAVGGVMLALFGLDLPFLVLLAAAAVNGGALEMCGVAWTTTLQERVPRDALGRISSVDALGSFALLPIGYGLTGWGVDHLGAPAVFLVGGTLAALVALAALLHPAARSLDGEPTGGTANADSPPPRAA